MPRAKKADWQQRIAEEMHRERKAQAENRRMLLAKLNPETREFARREFAKLGLYQ